jgi:tRNA threonylcarbamoyl adenosine modification protein YeaZ
VFVLAIDTSSPAVTAGVVTDAGELLAQRAPLAPRGHGELLAPSIAECLDEAGVEPAQIGAVVAGTGPGPYTGLRVGLVTAAAYADALGIPAYGICSLDAIGLACADEAAVLVATDARRHEVYWALYEYGVRAGDPAVARPAEVPRDGVTALAGAGAELYPDVWVDLPHRPQRYPDPVSLARLAVDRIRAAAPSEQLTPLYLRRPDAVVPGAPKTVTQK